MLCSRRLIARSLQLAGAYIKFSSINPCTNRQFSRSKTFRKLCCSLHIVTSNNYNNSNECNKKMYFLVSGGLFFGILKFFGLTEPEDETSEVIMTIKRSILAIQKGEFDKAEQLLHVALRQAQTLQHEDAITYVYDVMANLAFDTEDYKKAETLFLSVLQRILAKGVAQDDLKVIHISLKLANIYEQTGSIQKANIGYNYCLENLHSYLEKDSEDENALLLLAMTSDWYAKMLFSQTKYLEAHKYFVQAYDLCVKINGKDHEQTVRLLNDLGTVNSKMGEHDKALEYLKLAAEIGENLPDMVSLGAIHVNLGDVFVKKGLYDEAIKACKKGWKLSKNREDPDSLKEAEKCLSDIKKLMS